MRIANLLLSMLTPALASVSRIPESNIAPIERRAAVPFGHLSKGFYTPYRGENQRQRRKHARQAGKV